MGRTGIVIASEEKMRDFGRHVGLSLTRGSVLLLYGDLGAGKTTFAQGVAAGLGIDEPLQSPTFTYLNLYEEGRIPLYHFDLYRMKGMNDFLGLGFTDYLGQEGIALIEWAERLEGFPVEDALSFHFVHEGEGRKVFFHGSKLWGF